MKYQEEILKFFEHEYMETKKLAESRPGWLPDSFIQDTLFRCQGIAMFVQQIGVSFEEIEPFYNSYKEKIQKLIDN